jgi:hypothetical protein
MPDVYLGDLPLWSDPEAKEMLLKLCEKYQVPLQVFEDLVVIQRERQDQERARGVYDAITEVLGIMD